MKQKLRYLLPPAAWLLVAAGLGLRLIAACSSPLWVDEAESSINALTIHDHFVPVDRYLGQPIFENTLTEPWPESVEYEFRDSSYSRRGLAVYHAWLPLYAIAAAQWLCGLEPGQPSQPPTIHASNHDILKRTLVPRLPGLLFSVGFMIIMFLAGRELAGTAAGWSALAWSAFEDGVINRGHQARYYSLTLLMCAVFILLYFRAYRAGRMRDFVLLGLALGALFHTHQLSAVVASAVAAVGLRRIRRHPQWVLKCSVSATLAAFLILPWVALTGFSDTATSVPKAYALFDGWQDWLRYAASQRSQVAIGLGGLILIFALAWKKRSPDTPDIGDRWLLAEQSVILCLWAGFALLAFHLLIPAASFFPQRLTLMLIVPYGLLVAAVAGVLFETVSPRFSRAAAWTWTVSVLLITTSHTLPDIRTRDAVEKAISPTLQALSERHYPAGTRFYSIPNFHLIWSYYSGLPVQSIAPVRKSFLDRHPSTIVYLDLLWFNELAKPMNVMEAARDAGASVTLEQARDLANALWCHQAAEELAGELVNFDPPPPLPDFMAPIAEQMRRLSDEKRREHLRRYEHHPMFKGLPYSDPNKLWLAFFYRFSDLTQRIGDNANKHDRMIGARAIFVPESRVVIYESDYERSKPLIDPSHTAAL